MRRFGERDAIKLAFISDGTVVHGTGNDPTATVTAAGTLVSAEPGSLPARVTTTDAIDQANEAALIANPSATFASTTVQAQAVNLYDLNLPNPITTGYDAGKAFDVAAVDVIGYLGSSTPGYVVDPTTGDLIQVADPNHPVGT